MDGFVVHSDHISLNEMLTVNSHAISWLIPFFLYRRSTTYRGSFGNTLISVRYYILPMSKRDRIESIQGEPMANFNTFFLSFDFATQY